MEASPSSTRTLAVSIDPTPTCDECVCRHADTDENETYHRILSWSDPVQTHCSQRPLPLRFLRVVGCGRWAQDGVHTMLGVKLVMEHRSDRRAGCRKKYQCNQVTTASMQYESSYNACTRTSRQVMQHGNVSMADCSCKAVSAHEPSLFPSLTTSLWPHPQNTI